MGSQGYWIIHVIAESLPLLFEARRFRGHNSNLLVGKGYEAYIMVTFVLIRVDKDMVEGMLGIQVMWLIRAI